VRRFRKGHDYTVAHAHASVVVDVTLCFVLPDTDGKRLLAVFLIS
jgi:hypothetical protein